MGIGHKTEALGLRGKFMQILNNNNTPMYISSHQIRPQTDKNYLWEVVSRVGEHSKCSFQSCTKWARVVLLLSVWNVSLCMKLFMNSLAASYHDMILWLVGIIIVMFCKLALLTGIFLTVNSKTWLVVAVVQHSESNSVKCTSQFDSIP